MSRQRHRYRTFGELVDAHERELYRYLLRLTGDAAETDDLYQETFLRALPAFDRLRANSNHRAWVYRIATNAFLNHRRTATRRREVRLPVDLRATGSSPATRHDAKTTAAACRGAIARLPRRQRAAFVQRNVLGFSYAQVAVSMGCTESAARANVYQAVRRLRRALVAIG